MDLLDPIKESMDAYFNYHKVKFEVLYRLMNPIARRHQIHNVNVFINLDDLLHRLHRPVINDELTISTSNTIVRLVSSIINLAAHYREYMMREGWTPKVYLCYSSSFHGPFRNMVYIENYRDHFKTISSELNQEYAYLNRVIPPALNLVKSICQYIEGVYLVDSTYVEPSVLPLILSEMRHADYNFLVTRDEYDYQYTSYQNWAIIYANSDEEKSELITSSNLWKFVAEKNKVNTEDLSLDYQASLYSFVLSVTGNRYRGIPRIKKCGWSRILSIVDEISKEPTSITASTLREKVIDRLRGKTYLTLDQINANLACTDIQTQYRRLNMQTNSVLSMDLTTQMVDVPDYENLLTVDRIYFKDYHLNIPFLTKQMPDSPIVNRKFRLDKKGPKKREGDPV